MVGVSMTRNVDLVANNYYEKEIKYQEQIDLLKKTNALNENVKIDFDGSNVNISFPKNIDKNSLKGTVHFYRPSDSNKDFNIPVNSDANGTMKISNEKFSKGLWKVQINWENAGEKYFTEQTLLIQ
jgi:nitrogen fixation protein FixH